jgi:protein O-GlcNAc transferase
VRPWSGFDAAQRINGVAAERILFAPKLRNDEHLARLACADLVLDCFPYGSHTTASDALWAGVPLVALKGETFASRVSASILAAAGLGDLVATSFGDYLKLAHALATDRMRLQRTRARVKDCRCNSALFDTWRFTRSLETGFTRIFERHIARLAPDHISIE